MHDGRLIRLRSLAIGVAEKLSWLGPLLARLTVGLVFLSSGWGKLHNLDRVTAFFTELGIPMPAEQAVFVAIVEFVGGICLLLGLATRIMSIPLMVTMVVAILTAKSEEVTGVVDLIGLSEWAYLILLGWLVLHGAGSLSIDHLLARRLFGAKHSSAR